MCPPSSFCHESARILASIFGTFTCRLAEVFWYRAKISTYASRSNPIHVDSGARQKGIRAAIEKIRVIVLDRRLDGVGSVMLLSRSDRPSLRAKR